MTTFSFHKALLQWFEKEGRKDLPWQQGITPYRVWLSEVMLQQTQVSTVIPYFHRFIAVLPDIQSLATAPPDQVLQLWTGLGYYSRARNLHRSAKIIYSEYGGQFPDDQASIEALPGIGRSTAGAILSIALGKRAPILDGNVKRVLARFHGVDGWPGDLKVAAQLWEYAEKHTPSRNVAAYTQAIMDLGAMICTRSRPDCSRCPLNQECVAYKADTIPCYPGKKPRKALPARQVQLLMLRNGKGDVLLQQRPPSGIWGGLWCFPEIPEGEDPALACVHLYGKRPQTVNLLPGWRHTFSHFHLDITPVVLEVRGTTRRHPLEGQRWVNPDAESQTVGLAAPTCKLLALLASC